MDIEIDQSGKVEDTRVNTAIAFSNGKSKSILIDRREKRELKKILYLLFKQKKLLRP